MKLAVNYIYLNFYNDEYLIWISKTRGHAFVEEDFSDEWIQNTL